KIGDPLMPATAPVCSRFCPLQRIRTTSYFGLKFFRTETTSTSKRSIFVPLKTDKPYPVIPGLTSDTRMWRAGSKSDEVSARVALAKPQAARQAINVSNGENRVCGIGFLDGKSDVVLRARS